jgi:hypothetical protein
MPFFVPMKLTKTNLEGAPGEESNRGIKKEFTREW